MKSYSKNTVWPEYQTEIEREGKEIELTVQWEADGGDIMLTGVFNTIDPDCEGDFELTEEEAESIRGFIFECMQDPND